ncbi:MAG: hypothetical protein IPK57_17990 [Chitinophagaceae bacterium]|nr:hypothetical protein [Chitinophagaceae bacterium]
MKKENFTVYWWATLTDPVNISGIFHTKTNGIVVLKGKQHYFQQKNNPLLVWKKRKHRLIVFNGTVGFTYFLIMTGSRTIVIISCY